MRIIKNIKNENGNRKKLNIKVTKGLSLTSFEIVQRQYRNLLNMADLAVKFEIVNIFGKRRSLILDGLVDAHKKSEFIFVQKIDVFTDFQTLSKNRQIFRNSNSDLFCINGNFTGLHDKDHVDVLFRSQSLKCPKNGPLFFDPGKIKIKNKADPLLTLSIEVMPRSKV